MNSELHLRRCAIKRKELESTLIFKILQVNLKLMSHYVIVCVLNHKYFITTCTVLVIISENVRDYIKHTGNRELKILYLNNEPNLEKDHS